MCIQVVKSIVISRGSICGDKILSENYFQHADHFTRILNDQDTQKLNSMNNDTSKSQEI